MLHSFQAPVHACIFGAAGGIGAALAHPLAQSPDVARLHLGSRTAVAGGDRIIPFTFDLQDEASIAHAAHDIAGYGPLNLIIVATGLLHDGSLMQPEKSFRMQSVDAYERAFAVNAIGPALIGKHFLPLLPRDGRCVFAALSARVSSISDNRLGGWHAYRASKAALNMIVRNFALELGTTRKQAIAVTLHPGTVDTRLSEPFQKGVSPDKLFGTEQSATNLLTVIDGLTPQDSGGLFAWDGQRILF